MSKESEKKNISSAEERKRSAAREEQEVTELNNEAMALRENGHEVGDLIKNIQVIFLDLRNAERSAHDETRFNKIINKILKKKQEARAEIKKISGSEIKKDIQELEAEAAGEDLEFKKLEEKYADAKYNLEEFVNHIENLSRQGWIPPAAGEKDREEAVKDIKVRLAELYNLLKSKNYEHFKNKQDEFNNIIEDLYDKVEPYKKDEGVEKLVAALGLNEEEPAPVKPQPKPAEPKPMDVKKEREEQEKRDQSYENAESNFKLLKLIITNRGEKKDALKPFAAQFKKAETSLRAADVAKTPKVFAESLQNFEKAIAEILSKSEADTKNWYEKKKAGMKMPGLTEEETVELKPPKPEPKKVEPTPPQAPKVKKDVSEPVPPPPEPAAPITKPTELPAQDQHLATVHGEIANEVELESEKSWWGRIKERGKKFFNRETGKVAGKVSYDTITSVLGIKLATDAVYGLRTGKGDLAQWWKERKESKASQEVIFEAYQKLLESMENVLKGNKVSAESEKTTKRLDDFEAQVESAHISPEAKKALLDRLHAINIKNDADLQEGKKERDAEVRRVLDVYIQGKISGMRIARDAMNFVLTATGMSMLRGVAYAGASMLERAGKAGKEYAKQTSDGGEKKLKKELFVAKDVFVNSAIETARALIGKGEKKGAGGKTKAIDFVKALGAVARGLGIYGVAFSHAELPGQSIDKLISQIKEHGVVGAVSDNFIQNAERVGHFVTHPTEIFKGHKGAVAPRSEEYKEISDAAPEHPAPFAHPEPSEELAPTNIEPRQIDVVTLDDSEGVLHGANKLLKAHPEFFQHEDGRPWTADEIHKWKVDELKEMGFKFKGDKWGYPMTIHGGAQVELFTDADGRPHFKLAGDEHVTWHKNYKWVDTEPDITETKPTITEAVAPASGVEPPPSPAERFAAGEHTSLADRAYGMPPKGELMTNYLLDAKPLAAKPEMELMTDYLQDKKIEAPALTPVERTWHADRAGDMPASTAQGGAKDVVKVVAPAVENQDMSVPEFFKGHGSSPREFVNTYDKMVDATVEKFNNSFIFRGNSEKLLQDRIEFLYSGKNGINFPNLSSSNPTDSDTLKIIGKVLEAEEKFKFHQPDWMRDFRLALFDKSDKTIGLALAPDRDVLLNPFMTNDGHAARIWDPTEGKDVFIYDKDKVFKISLDGQLAVEDENGETRLFTHQSALKMSEKL